MRGKLWPKALLGVGSLALALLSAEGVMRVRAPYSAHGAAVELPWMRENPYDLTTVFTVDPEFGFRPILGNEYYNEFGTLVADYPVEKRPGIERLLFLGDSVTFRGRIVDALKAAAGEERYEYWNAGVESYNTVQEANYYRRYNAALQPDHVILTFHLNDLETTPIAFESGGKLVVYAPHRPLRRVSQPLFEHSHLYRLWLGAVLGDGTRDEAAIEADVRAALADLAEQTHAGGARLSVLVLPVFGRPETWTNAQRTARETIREILTDQGIRHFDLAPVVQRAVEAGIEVQDPPGDSAHPSEAAAERMAGWLLGEGLLDRD